MATQNKNWLTFIVVLLYIPYVLLYLFEQQYNYLRYIEGLPAIVAIIIFYKFGGFSREDLYLSRKKISRVGVYLTIIILSIFVIIAFFGQAGGFSIETFLFTAPMSAITQELYFRCSLQVAFERIQHFSYRKANMIHSIFFIGWHLRLFLETTSPLAWIGLIVGLGFFGLVWGFQSRKDGTIFYVMVIHVFALMAQCFFLWNLGF